MLSFLGFEIVIVAMLHPGRYSSMSHLTVACSSLVDVPYDRARLGSSLAWIRPRRADRGVLFDVLIVLQSNGNDVSAVSVLRRKCEALNGALHLNATRAVGQTIVFLLAATRFRVPNRCAAAVRSATVQNKYIHSEIQKTASIRAIGNNEHPLIKLAYQALAIGSEPLEAIHVPANAMQCELPVAVIPVPKGFPAERHSACPTSTSTVDERWTLA